MKNWTQDEMEVEGTERNETSRARPRYGVIRLRNVTTNQRGEVVQTMLASAMVSRRAQFGVPPLGGSG